MRNPLEKIDALKSVLRNFSQSPHDIHAKEELLLFIQNEDNTDLRLFFLKTENKKSLIDVVLDALKNTSRADPLFEEIYTIAITALEKTIKHHSQKKLKGEVLDEKIAGICKKFSAELVSLVTVKSTVVMGNMTPLGKVLYLLRIEPENKPLTQWLSVILNNLDLCEILNFKVENIADDNPSVKVSSITAFTQLVKILVSCRMQLIQNIKSENIHALISLITGALEKFYLAVEDHSVRNTYPNIFAQLIWFFLTDNDENKEKYAHLIQLTIEKCDFYCLYSIIAEINKTMEIKPEVQDFLTTAHHQKENFIAIDFDTLSTDKKLKYLAQLIIIFFNYREDAQIKEKILGLITSENIRFLTAKVINPDPSRHKEKMIIEPLFWHLCNPTTPLNELISFGSRMINSLPSLPFLDNPIVPNQIQSLEDHVATLIEQILCGYLETVEINDMNAAVAGHRLPKKIGTQSSSLKLLLYMLTRKPDDAFLLQLLQRAVDQLGILQLEGMYLYNSYDGAGKRREMASPVFLLVTEILKVAIEKKQAVLIKVVIGILTNYFEQKIQSRSHKTGKARDPLSDIFLLADDKKIFLNAFIPLLMRESQGPERDAIRQLLLHLDQKNQPIWPKKIPERCDLKKPEKPGKTAGMCLTRLSSNFFAQRQAIALPKTRSLRVESLIAALKTNSFTSEDETAVNKLKENLRDFDFNVFWMKNPKMLNRFFHAFLTWSENRTLQNPLVQWFMQMTKQFSPEVWVLQAESGSLFPLALLVTYYYKNAHHPALLNLTDFVVTHLKPTAWIQTWTNPHENTFSPLLALADWLYYGWFESDQPAVGDRRQWRDVDAKNLSLLMRLLPMLDKDTWPSGLLYKGREIETLLSYFTKLAIAYPERPDVWEPLYQAIRIAPDNAWRSERVFSRLQQHFIDCTEEHENSQRQAVQRHVIDLQNNATFQMLP